MTEFDNPVPSAQPPAKPSKQPNTVYGYVKIRDDGSYTSTEKAILFIINGNEQWIPKSQMTGEFVDNGEEQPIPIKEFLAKKLLKEPAGQITPEVKKPQENPAPAKQTQAMVEKKPQNQMAVPAKQNAPQTALKTLPSRGQFYKPEGNKEVPDAWEVQKHANEAGLACQVMEMGRTTMGAFAKVRVFKPEAPQQFIEAEVYYDYSIMLEKLTLDALAKTRIHPTGFDEKGKPLLNNQDALYLYGLWVRKKQFADRQCETQAFARAQYKFLNHEWRESVEKEIEQEEIADVKVLKDAPKKAFSVKMPPAKEEKPAPTPEEKAEADQEEDAEINAILNEQNTPEEEPQEEMSDTEALCNALVAIKGIPYTVALKTAQLRDKHDQKGMKDAFQKLIQEAI